MMNKKESEKLITSLVEKLQNQFDDFKGLYFYGSRMQDNHKNNSDYDFILQFDKIYYEKSLIIAGIVTDIEYIFDEIIDYKIFTTFGKKSISHIRNKVNPIFIEHVIDNGIFYAAT